MAFDGLDATLVALADPTRRAILARLAQGEVTVMDLAQPFHMSQPAISKHLKVLEGAGLVSRGRDGTRRPVRAETRRLRQTTQWLEDFCARLEGNYLRLDALLQEMKTVEDDRT